MVVATDSDAALDSLRRKNRPPVFLMDIDENAVEYGTHAAIFERTAEGTKVSAATVVHVYRPEERVPLLYKGAILAVRVRDERDDTDKWFVRGETVHGNMRPEGDCLILAQPQDPTLSEKQIERALELGAGSFYLRGILISEETRLWIGARSHQP